MIRVARVVTVLAALGVATGTACSTFGTSGDEVRPDGGPSDSGTTDAGNGNGEHRIYVFGGSSGTPSPSALKTAYFSVADVNGDLGAWTELPALEDERYGAAHAQLGDSVYVLGGTALTTAFARTSERATLPATASDPGAIWSTRASLATGRNDSAAVVRGTNIYVGGGRNDAGTPPNVERYDSVHDAWTGAGPLAAGVAGHAMLLRNDVLYVLGGDRGITAGGPTSAVHRAVFTGDDSLAPFETAGTLETALAYHSIAFVDPWVFTIGGSTGTSVVPDVWRGTFADAGSIASWQSIAPLPDPAGQTGLAEACTLVVDRTIYVMGGRDVATAAAKRDVYIGRVDGNGAITWSKSATPLPEGRAAFGCAVSPSSAP